MLRWDKKQALSSFAVLLDVLDSLEEAPTGRSYFLRASRQLSVMSRSSRERHRRCISSLAKQPFLSAFSSQTLTDLVGLERDGVAAALTSGVHDPSMNFLHLPSISVSASVTLERGPGRTSSIHHRKLSNVLLGWIPKCPTHTANDLILGTLFRILSLLCPRIRVISIHLDTRQDLKMFRHISRSPSMLCSAKLPQSRCFSSELESCEWRGSIS
jgi:hypothetical protein